MLSKSASIISHIEDGLWTEVVYYSHKIDDLLLLVILSVLLCLTGFLFKSQILKLFGANPEEKVCYDYAVQYFTVICIHVADDMSYNNEKLLRVEYILQRLICHAMRWQESIW